MIKKNISKKLFMSAAILAMALSVCTGCSGSDISGSDNSGSDNYGSDNSGSDNSGSDNSGSDISGSTTSGSDTSGSGSSGSSSSGSESSGGDEESRSLVYEDMEKAYVDAGLMSSNIGIFTKTESDGAVSYGNCGSGVIFEESDGYYYALTAAHVASTETGSLLVFTVNTDMEGEVIPGMEDLDTLSQETYESMYDAEAVFISDKDDVAVIRFASEEDLACVNLADEDPAVGDRIMCIGNPENDWFAISYGEITGGLESFGEFEGYPTNGMKHSAYIQVGSSGGAAIGEQMTLVGINPGAGLSLDGSTFKYGVMIPVSEIRSCLEDWER